MVSSIRCVSRNGEGNAVDVAIAGGGIIALALAWRARARGLSVTVLERENARLKAHVEELEAARVTTGNSGPLRADQPKRRRVRPQPELTAAI